MNEDQMYELVKEDPNKLIAEMKKMKTEDLTFAVEILGGHCNTPESRAYLISLTKHINAVVREGAVYGLEYNIEGSGVIEALERLRKDPSPGVREAVMDILDEWS